MDDFEKELKEDFLLEAKEMLEEFEQIFLDLEQETSEESIDKIFRFAHNLKGTSRAVGFGDIAEFTHEMENLILCLKNKEFEPSEEVISILLDCNDHVTNMINKLDNDLDASTNNEEIILKIKSLLASKGLGEDNNTPPAKHVAPEPIIVQPVLAEVSSEEEVVQYSQEDLEAALLQSMDSFVAPVLTEPAAVDPEPPKIDVVTETTQGAKVKRDIKTKKVEKEEFLRVSLKKVEKLNDFVGELVILQSVFKQNLATDVSVCTLTEKTVQQLGKISRELQDISMSLRMVPIKSTLQKMNRIVRDTSKALDKKVKLVIEGESTEIDKTILEYIVDPMVHIVRNAVDHGVESPQERLDSGKNPEGNISLKAFHRGNNLVIEIIDDGKGIDAESLRQKAINKGVITDSIVMTDEEIINLIFHPGFSTKEQVSEVSGRGVGMDVVKTNIEKLSGSVKVYSKVGQGSRVEVILPLTLAIIDGVVVTTGVEKFVLPLTQVREFVKPSEGALSYITNIGECFSMRGEVLPVFDLADKVGQIDQKLEGEEYVFAISSLNSKSFAVKIKDILNQQQTVVKDLGPNIKDKKGLVGASILGDGNPAFIIDIESLFEKELDLIPELNTNRGVAV